MRLLVVDDHAPFRARLRGILESSGIGEITEAADATTAVDALAAERFDAMTLDLSLGEESGFHLLSRIRREHPGVPVLILSLQQGSVYAEHSRTLGAGGYLRKDLAATQLIGALRQILTGRWFDSESLPASV